MFPNMMEARALRMKPAGGVKDGFFWRRIARPVVVLLRHGVTPEKMALSLALGVALGVFPVMGATTALCALAALIGRLNLPAIQIVNYFVFPLQIALLIPFFLMGEKLFLARHLPLSAAQVAGMLHANFWGATRLLWTTTWHAVVVWCVAAPVFVGAAYLILVPILRGVARRTATAKARV
jgi:uncharacterized protein (DUF2062 family)